MLVNIRGRVYRLIPFIVLTLILLFCFVLIVNAAYKYHLETEDRRFLMDIDIDSKVNEKFKDLIKKHEEEINKLKLEKENIQDILNKSMNKEIDLIKIKKEFGIEKIKDKIIQANFLGISCQLTNMEIENILKLLNIFFKFD